MQNPPEREDPRPEPDGRRRGRFWLAVARTLGALGLLALLGGSLLCWSARWFWLGEVAASFAWYLGLAGLAGTVLLLLVRCPRMALAAAVLSTLQLWPELSLWLPDSRSGEVEEEGDRITIACSNLLWTNTDWAGVTELIERTSPDVMVLLEASLFWREGFEGLSDEYPHQLYSPAEQWNEETWGTAILSRRPMSRSSLIPLPGERVRPPMEAVIELGGEPAVIRGAHPMRPGKAWRIERRDAVLDALAGLDWSGHGMLLGDLNTSSTSPTFGRLLRATGLRDSRLGFGRQPTYRTNDLIPGLRVAIDHILVSDSIHVLERWTELLPGSDHRTVVARVMLRRE